MKEKRTVQPPEPTCENVKVCGCRPHEGGAAHAEGRRPQTSNGGNRGRCGEVARQTLWGFGGCEWEYNFCDMARTLRMGENAFRRSCNFSELGVVKMAHMRLVAAFVPHRSN